MIAQSLEAIASGARSVPCECPECACEYSDYPGGDEGRAGALAQPVATWRTLHERQAAVLRRAWVCADGHDAHSHRAMPSHADRWIDPPRTQGTAVYSVTRSTRGTHADPRINRRVQNARASSHAATCACSRRRSRPIQPYLNVLLVGRYGRSMRIIDTIAITPAIPPSRTPRI